MHPTETVHHAARQAALFAAVGRTPPVPLGARVRRPRRWFSRITNTTRSN